MLGLLLPFVGTSLGAALVFVLRKSISANLQKILTGFAAAVTIVAAGTVIPVMPYLLAFAAGAMMYVVVEELIPEMSEGKHSNWGTIAFSLGFVLMMVLDVTLG